MTICAIFGQHIRKEPKKKKKVGEKIKKYWPKISLNNIIFW